MNNFSGKAKYDCMLKSSCSWIIIILYLTTDWEMSQQFFSTLALAQEAIGFGV